MRPIGSEILLFRRYSPSVFRSPSTQNFQNNLTRPIPRRKRLAAGWRTPRTRKTKRRDTLPADHTALSSVGQADHPSRSRNCTALWQDPNPSRNTREILDHKGSGNSWKTYSKLHHLPHGKSQSYTTTDGPSPSSSSAVPHPATHQYRN